ncbi:hypothetical protein BV25DRAFT_1344155 [Artomyces pyxidatus]|uniref:Uncharacterized protein n=1 Tax=Artomyces pyxidatus TaxID=48021 RepID=A0ACB8SPS1_9AGAM|nr:hypothetical protein BV25DRAFT_1344155 [Artomyces pyxidatus]
MEGQEGAPSRRSSLPPSLHSHLRSAPQSTRSASSSVIEPSSHQDTPEDDEMRDRERGREQGAEYAPQGPASSYPLRPLVPPLPAFPTSLERVMSLPPLRRERSPEPDERWGGSGDERMAPAAPSSIPHGSAARTAAPAWSTDPAFYTYPPPTPRYAPAQAQSWSEGEAGPSTWPGRQPPQEYFDYQALEDEYAWERGPPQARWRDSATRIRRAESYTRADDFGWEGGFAARRFQAERRGASLGEWGGSPAPGQGEGPSRTRTFSVSRGSSTDAGARAGFSLSPHDRRGGYSLSPHDLRAQRALPQTPPSRLNFETLGASPDSVGTRALIRAGIVPSPNVFHQSLEPHDLAPGLSSVDEPYVSPLLEPILLGVQRANVDGSPSQDYGELLPGVEKKKRTGARKGKRRRVEDLAEDDERDDEQQLATRAEKRPRAKKKTEVACDFCRREWASVGPCCASVDGDVPSCRAQTGVQRRQAELLCVQDTAPGVLVRARRATARARQGAARQQEAQQGAHRHGCRHALVAHDHDHDRPRRRRCDRPRPQARHPLRPAPAGAQGLPPLLPAGGPVPRPRRGGGIPVQGGGPAQPAAIHRADGRQLEQDGPPACPRHTPRPPRGRRQRQRQRQRQRHRRRRKAVALPHPPPHRPPARSQVQACTLILYSYILSLYLLIHFNVLCHARAVVFPESGWALATGASCTRVRFRR